MASADDHITWLHLSDYHAGQPGEPARPAVEEAFERSVKQTAERLGVPDLLLFTGDMAYQGRATEYELVDGLLDRIKRWLGVELPVFAVPGNHDLQRPGAEEAWRFEPLARFDDNPQFRAALFAGRAEHVATPFADYVTWAKDRVFAPAEAAGWPVHVSERIPGDFSVVFEKHCLRLGIVGLNSAWVQYGNGEFEGKLQLPAEQFLAALPPAPQPLEWFAELDAALLLTHHPRSWLSRRALEIYRRDIHPPGRFDLALFGHMHDAHSEVTSEAGTRARAFFQAPSLFGLEHYGEAQDESRSFGYAWGRVEASGQLRVWPKRVVERAGGYAFVDDARVEPIDDLLGGVCIRPPRPAPRPEAPSPSSTSTTAPSPTEPSPTSSIEELDRYRARVESEHRDIKLFGFASGVRVPLDLDGLYVPLSAVIDHGAGGREVHASGELADKAAARMGGIQRPVALADAFDYALERERRGLIILGDPGSGKTTHLRQMLLQVVRHGSKSIGLPSAVVPVFLPLEALRDRAAGLDAFIDQQLRGPAQTVDPGFGQRMCRRGKLLLLFDGLDEVADAGERAQVASWINQALATMPNCYFVVTSRYAGYTKATALDARFLELHLRPLDTEQMQTFVHNWYRIVETQLSDDASELTEARARAQAEELLAALTDTRLTAAARVYEMTRNPLLLTAICLIHRDQGRLPTARVKLYEECVHVLLERWQRRRREAAAQQQGGQPAPLSAEEAHDVLRSLAAWMHEQDERTRATGAELLEPLRVALAPYRSRGIEAAALLEMIRDESGLLTGWGVDEYGFMHLGLQEFLTAEQLRNDSHQDSGALDTLAGRFGDSWWQEVILLMLALHNPPVFEPFMAALVRQPQFDAWANSAMMDKCFTEAARPSAKPFTDFIRTAVVTGKTTDPHEAALDLLERKLPDELEALRDALSADSRRKVRARAARLFAPRRASDGAEVRIVEGVELVRIAGGRFVMGSPEGVGHDNERPQHEVELASFYLAATPVTNAQYERYLLANPAAPKPAYWGEREYNQPEQPVVGVSWEEARMYCAWAGLELPTEAQWEVACREGTTTRYWSGDEEADLARVGWYSDNSGDRLHTVGEKQANGGLYDMHGNVWEWCLDDASGGLESYTTGARAGDGLRREPVGDGYRVMRGGGWNNGADYARSAYRYRFGAGYRNRFVGFRPAQGIP